MSAVVALADAIKNNGALTSVNMISNKIGAKQANKLIAIIMASKPNLKTLCGFSGEEAKLDLSNKGLSTGCGVLVANEVKNNGALENLHIGNNKIPIENMNEIIAIVEAKPVMKTLCAVPFGDKTITELDVSGQSLGVEGALVVSRYLEDNRVLTSLNLADNRLKAEGAKHVVEAIKGHVSALQFN